MAACAARPRYHPRKRKELVGSKAAVTLATGRRYLLRHAGMSRDFVGPAFKLQHGVFVQKLREQEHTTLGESTGRALLFPPRHTWTGRARHDCHAPASFARTPGTLCSEYSFSSRQLLLELSTTTFPCPSLHPRRVSTTRAQAAGDESRVSVTGLREPGPQ